MTIFHDPVTTPYPPKEFLEYFDLFNAGDYFEAHEILEDLWVMTPGLERNFYKGLIMLAVGLLHAERGNARGAQGVLTGALEHLDPYPESFGGLMRSEAVGRARQVLAGLVVPKTRPTLKRMD
jgi:predicted metal-dependent hydrolase